MILTLLLFAFSFAQRQHSFSQSTASFLKAANNFFEDSEHRRNVDTWLYETNITDYNQQVLAKTELDLNSKLNDFIKRARMFTPTNDDEKRQLELIRLKSGAPSKPEDQLRLSDIQAKMVEIYSTATVDGLPLEPDLTDILRTSRDYNQLLKVYTGFRNATGPLIKAQYTEFVKLQNTGAKEAGFKNMGELWQSQYDMTSNEFREMMEDVWQKILPLYEGIHCWAKYKLNEKYGSRVKIEDDLIPAHLFGNMWSQGIHN